MINRKNTKDVDMDKVIAILKKEVVKYDVPVIDLIKIQTDEPFKILIGTILSARTKDSMTAKVLERLFEKVKSFDDLENLSENEIASLIYPVGFYKNKAKHLKELPKVIRDEFDGEIPRAVDDLVKLPGVGRKTANLVSSVAFEEDAICVDTHVHRITNRLGYVSTKKPLETEMTLRKKLPTKHWHWINRLFVAFGQNICTPISPHCSICPIKEKCNRIGVNTNR